MWVWLCLLYRGCLLYIHSIPSYAFLIPPYILTSISYPLNPLSPPTLTLTHLPLTLPHTHSPTSHSSSPSPTGEFIHTGASGRHIEVNRLDSMLWAQEKAKDTPLAAVCHCHTEAAMAALLTHSFVSEGQGLGQGLASGSGLGSAHGQGLGPVPLWRAPYAKRYDVCEYVPYLCMIEALDQALGNGTTPTTTTNNNNSTNNSTPRSPSWVLSQAVKLLNAVTGQETGDSPPPLHRNISPNHQLASPGQETGDSPPPLHRNISPLHQLASPGQETGDPPVKTGPIDIPSLIPHTPSSHITHPPTHPPTHPSQDPMQQLLKP